MTISGLQADGSKYETRRAKIIRAALGAFYSFLAGVAFVFMATFVDIWLYPDLPLGADWQTLWARLPLFGLGLALVGAVTCWWDETWSGLFSGAVTASVLALIVALSSSNQVAVGMKFMVLVFILVPIAAMMVPITWIMRWFVERHAGAMTLKGTGIRIAGLMILALLLGAAAGYFMKMSLMEIEATRYFHALLQSPPDETSPLGKLDGISEHQGMPYQLYSTESQTSTEGVDIRAEFEDGYVVKCTAVLYPGHPPYISGCTSE